MSSLYVPPSTMDGIKRLATSIKREQRIPHHRALDLAAQRAGFQNIRDAQRRLQRQPGSAGGPGHALFLTAYWHTRTRPFAWGRETLRVVLPKPLAEIAKRSELAADRSVGWFKVDATDHLERRLDDGGKENAREGLLAAARALQFMAVTGLRPATSRKQRARLDLDQMPDRDHQTTWIDPTNGEVVSLDEPYGKPADIIAERAAWLAEAGLVMFAPSWEGLYAPGHSHPFFVLRDAALGRQIQAKVEALKPLAALEWDSGMYGDRFVSPARADAGKPPTRRTMPAYRGSIRAGAVAYGGRPGERSLWRPAVPMPLPQHQALGRHLKALSLSGLPARVRDVIGHTRSLLEDWAFAEHGDEADRYPDLYYGGSRKGLDRDGAREALAAVIHLIGDGYQECPPKRQMLASLKRAEAKV